MLKVLEEEEDDRFLSCNVAFTGSICSIRTADTVKKTAAVREETKIVYTIQNSIVYRLFLNTESNLLIVYVGNAWGKQASMWRKIRLKRTHHW